MRKLVSALGSLKLTVILVLLLGVVLAAGTIVESTRGAEAAQGVYYAPWFFALQGLFALNVICALVERWPRNRWRVGFAITHLSMLLILFGAVVTAVYKKEGQLPLWEGEESRSVAPRPDSGGKGFDLPFAIRLDAFELDVYPGTQRPAQFRSRVQVHDARRAAQPAVIEMNRPLDHGGYSFFQSSYHVEQGRKMSVLSVSRDPGQPIVFLGYVLLVAGMIVVFATRLVQHRQIAMLSAPAGLSLPALALVLAALSASAHAAQVPDAGTVERLRVLPVQHDGRTMAFDTQAREAVRTITGRAAWPGIDPVAMVTGWTVDPEGWDDVAMIKVGGPVVAETLGLPRDARYVSLDRLLSTPALLRAAAAAHESQDHDRKLTKVEKELLALEERVKLLYSHFKGTAIRPIPVGEPAGTWRGMTGQRSARDLAALQDRIRASDPPSHYPPAPDMRREVRYNAVRPSRLSWLLLLPAAIAAGMTVGADRFRLRALGGVLLVGGFLAMTWGIAMRWQIAGRIPAANMYESMLFLGWGVGLFGVLALALRQRLLIANAAGMGALAMMLVDLLPMDPFIHPIAPVLSGTPWLAIHVPIIVVSYSVLAMATGLAHLVIGVEIFAPARRELAARWSELLYWYLHVGSILLIAGILTGSIWAASSWGRYWGWDPKEVWSLVAFLAYMAILHARADGQVASFGVAAASIAAFWTILMTYLGVNYVLASGLHSYGFGASNLVLILAAVALAEVAFLGQGWIAHRKRLPALVLKPRTI